MSGGRAYVYDPKGVLPTDYNDEMVRVEKLDQHPSNIKEVEKLIYLHLEKTESPLANEIMKDWTNKVKDFFIVIPNPAAAKPASKPVHELAEKSSDKKPPVGGF